MKISMFIKNNLDKMLMITILVLVVLIFRKVVQEGAIERPLDRKSRLKQILLRRKNALLAKNQKSKRRRGSPRISGLVKRGPVMKMMMP
jgi:hypothetical protein